jgi:formate hydrogenlyase subunit 3/multisubunit Na+/H+ antiporter MnhD subunit
MVGFYFLLALLTLGACGLVIYHETPSAWRAGAVYIGFGLLAESLLLMALVLLAAQVPSDSLLIRDAAAALPTSPQRDLILVLLIAGLGMKAGYDFYLSKPCSPIGVRHSPPQDCLRRSTAS